MVCHCRRFSMFQLSWPPFPSRPWRESTSTRGRACTKLTPRLFPSAETPPPVFASSKFLGTPRQRFSATSQWGSCGSSLQATAYRDTDHNHVRLRQPICIQTMAPLLDAAWLRIASDKGISHAGQWPHRMSSSRLEGISPRPSQCRWKRIGPSTAMGPARSEDHCQEGPQGIIGRTRLWRTPHRPWQLHHASG